MTTIDHDDEDATSSEQGLRVYVRSATKDSLAVVWRAASDYDQQSSVIVSGYKVRYQAVGSTVVQYSHLLQVGYPLVVSFGFEVCKNSVYVQH